MVAVGCLYQVIAAATMGKDPVCVAIGEAMNLNIMPTATELRMGLQNSQDILKRLKVQRQDISPAACCSRAPAVSFAAAAKGRGGPCC